MPPFARSFQVSKTLMKSWLVRYRGINGKRREIGLGAYSFVTLAKAREKANDANRSGT